MFHFKRAACPRAVLRVFLRKMKKVGFCQRLFSTYRPFCQNGTAKRFLRNPCGSKGSRTIYAKRFAGTVIILITVPGAFFYKKKTRGRRKTICLLRAAPGPP
jgi:hypothetical protein